MTRTLYVRVQKKMKEVSEATAHREKRRELLVSILRENGGPMTTEMIFETLEFRELDPGYQKRVRRDLEALDQAGTVAKVRGDLSKSGRSITWKLGRGSFDLALTPEESLTLTALFIHGERFGLWVNSEQLLKLREYASGEIARGSAWRLISAGRITSDTRFTVLKPGVFNPSHLKTIQAAMINGDSLKIRYRPRGAGPVECTYLLRPLALAYQDSNIYLSTFVARETWHGQEPAEGTPRGKHSGNGPGQMAALMLHRMVDVSVAREVVDEPPGYDVRSIEAQRDLMTVHSTHPIDLVLRLTENLSNRLTENALADDQTIDPDGDRWLLRCSVPDSQGLRLFLLSNAPHIEVVSPLDLRTHIHSELKAALSQYEE